uniref:Uncharacterized protein n=1 Tax=Anguilla anguilla TaxID=7936 RepID=A0A0E9XL51_ANGAN
MPMNAHSRNIFSGTLTRYSWKNAETRNTAACPINLLTPLFSIGL